jgi:hypothetical protein
MKDKQFEWKEQKKLLKQAIRVESYYGDYSVLLLPNERFVILDRTNLKFLLPSSGPLYTLPDNWEQWMKRGFIVVAFHRAFRYFEYYIFSAQDKRFIVKAKEVEADAFLKDESDYFVVKNDDSKEAIFDKNGNQVSYWYDHILPDGLVKGQSDYYIVRNDKDAIFHKDGRQISDWFGIVYSYGLVRGQSDYYIARKDGKYAIFQKDGQRITDWYDDIDEYGLVTNESDFYIAKKGDKKAIFQKDGKQITDWFDWVNSFGLVDGESEYYIARKNGKEAIFHQDGNQISQLFDWIEPEGLVYGQSEYYVGKVDDLYYDFHYICKLGSIKVIGPFKKITDYGFIKDLSQNRISVMTLTDQQKTLTKQEIDNFFKENEVEDER